MNPLKEQALSPIAMEALGSSKTRLVNDGPDGVKRDTGCDDEFSVSTMSHHEPHVNTKQQAALDERRNLAKRESQAVWWLRMVVVAVFLVLTIAASLVAYFYIQDTEEDKFESEFEFYATSVVNHFNSGIEKKLNALDAMSVGITSFAVKEGLTFPFVTIPDFEYRGANLRIAGDTPMAFYSPVVTESNRLAWEEYSRNNNGHVRESYTVESMEKTEQDEKFGLDPELEGYGVEALEDGAFDDFDMEAAPVIFFPSEDGIVFGDQLQTPHFPVWHFTPLLPNEVALVNLDIGMIQDQKDAMDGVLQSGDAALSDFGNYGEFTDIEDAAFDLLLQFSQYRYTSQHFLGDPVSSFVYPVFDTFTENKTVAAAITIQMYWRLLFFGILPQQINGVVCVVENNFGQQVSYRIDGPESTFLGLGDWHSKAFDDLGVSTNVQKSLRERAGPTTQSFTVTDLNINYTIHLYPTQEFKDIYVTGDAKTQAIAVGVILLVALLIFAVYDCYVQKRQRIVMDRAVKATAVVSSLFPQQVREQVINDHANYVEKPASNKESFLTVDTKEGESESANHLAEKYPNCTVFFADLAGFTKWSSIREPEQVFRLLEAMFKEFDAVALRRGVFKVETIGDCYMAVTGLPEAQPDHAVRMAKFATDCLRKLDEVTTDLSDSLGEGTDDLTLRIGMHSGEVTGGVLRGDKSRFQLFGDTVNTASRMESTGKPRQIQCSQTTADALIMAGKSSWLNVREDKVVAKGKGEMQTYFVLLKEKTDTKSAGHSISDDS